MLSSSGSPERPAQVWTNHLLQSSMKVWHHLGFCLTDTTEPYCCHLAEPHRLQVCIKSQWFWCFYGLTLCSAGVCVKDITPTNLQLLKTITRQSLSILMTSVSQWTSNKPMSHWKAVHHVRPLLWSLIISIICIFAFMSHCRNRDLPFIIFPQLPWTF